ncbi:MAG: universal stress protein [Betaproteobacteria bacterium]|nr:universal stress protein [Betaproteobacteria bacterium]MDH4326423.1 universal stress protein [Betaproteobacteria bacterium]MDH5211847.1 universal stress protein [Betaproteobacteria bacterium]MDH5578114.1 universal stress protein [Betaproteobacteria bacterium]
MFKHILISTDGSRLSAKGVKVGVALARALGARVTGVYVSAPWTAPIYSEGVVYGAVASPQQYKRATEQEARKALATIEIEAQAADVPCAKQHVTADQPWQGILRVARAKKCDAIAMASHGRGGLSGLLIGSETQRVLAHSKLPVLVMR